MPAKRPVFPLKLLHLCLTHQVRQQAGSYNDLGTTEKSWAIASNCRSTLARDRGGSDCVYGDWKDAFAGKRAPTNGFG